MKSSKYTWSVLLASAGAATILSAIPASAAEVSLTAVTALQRNNTIARSFIENYIPAANKACKGMVNIKYIGGQEIVPPRKAANALKRGQFDMLNSPTAYYIGTVPEGFALLAGNQAPKQLRKNGAWEILQEVYLKKAGAHLLAYGESLTSYNMYLAKKPPIKDGIPDLTGMKMRATGTYRPLFRALGATTINIKSSEILNAMQRGTVDGFGFPDVSIIALGFHKVAKFRVVPNFYQTNQVVTVNKKVWDKLGKKTQDCLTNVAKDYESKSVIWVEKNRVAEEKQLKAAGVQDIVLDAKGAAKYVDLAHQEIWKALKAKSEYHDKLKPLLYVPGKPVRQVDLKSLSGRHK